MLSAAMMLRVFITRQRQRFMPYAEFAEPPPPDGDAAAALYGCSRCRRRFDIYAAVLHARMSCRADDALF